MNPGDKSTLRHWDEVWKQAPRMRLPWPVTASACDRMGLLQREVKPGMRLLEIGCAPGKILAYAAAVLGAQVSGIDYSERGLNWNRQLFATLGIKGDLRCEDIFRTTFPDHAFDVVYSGGVIEHFDDPSEIVRIHLRLVKPGGVVLITIPNFAGFYRRLAAEENLAIHNTGIMNREALLKLCPRDLTASAEAYPYGRFSLGTASALRKIFPRSLSMALVLLSEIAGLMQPFHIPSLCPHLVLRIQRKHPTLPEQQ